MGYKHHDGYLCWLGLLHELLDPHDSLRHCHVSSSTLLFPKFQRRCCSVHRLTQRSQNIPSLPGSAQDPDPDAEEGRPAGVIRPRNLYHRRPDNPAPHDTKPGQLARLGEPNHMVDHRGQSRHRRHLHPDARTAGQILLGSVEAVRRIGHTRQIFGGSKGVELCSSVDAEWTRRPRGGEDHEHNCQSRRRQYGEDI